MTVDIQTVISWSAKLKEITEKENASPQELIECLDWEINHYMDEYNDKQEERYDQRYTTGGQRLETEPDAV